MTGLFIDNGPVVQVKGPDGRTQPYKDPEPGLVWEGPLVVMINKFSASASEIFAGAIQDYGRGIVIGDKATHGKGTVQQLFDLGNALFRIREVPNMGALKLTIQQFYRPGGDSTQNRGVVSDVELPSLTTQLDVGEVGPRLRPEVQPGRSAAARQLPHGRFQAWWTACGNARTTVSRSPSISPRKIGEIEPVRGAKGQEDGHAQQGEVPEGAGRAGCRQRTGKAVRRR